MRDVNAKYILNIGTMYYFTHPHNINLYFILL